MCAEVPLQFDMFSGDLVDTRSANQRARDREREKPKQTEMFSQRDIAQFGVRAHPQMSLSDHTKMVLISEDPRTPDEIERDRQRAAEALTLRMFAAEDQPDGEITIATLPEARRVEELPPLIVGYRFRQRYFQAKVRRRVAKKPAA